MRDYPQYPQDHRDAQEQLYKDALESPVSTVAADWLYKGRLLLQIAGDNPDAAKSVIHGDAGKAAAAREYKSLGKDERARIGEEVGMLWASCVKEAILRLWHACLVLEIDPASMGVDMVALHAATLLSKSDTAEVGS